jgi:hypothetical protein
MNRKIVMLLIRFNAYDFPIGRLKESVAIQKTRRSYVKCPRDGYLGGSLDKIAKSACMKIP